MRCANCLRKYSAYSLANANWCRTDHVFLCFKCAGPSHVCPICGSRTTGLPQAALFLGALFAVIFSLLLASLAPDWVSEAQLSSMRVTPVSEVGVSGTAKVYGTVSAGQGTPVVVYTTGLGSNAVTYREVRNFFLNDSTGSLLVVMGSDSSTVPSIAASSHPYATTGSTGGFQYSSGDAVSVVGAVSRVGNQTEIRARAVAPAPGAFGPTDLVVNLSLFGGPGAIGWALVIGSVAVIRGRSARHELELPRLVASRPRSLAERPAADEVTWLPNSALPTLRRYWIVAGGILAATATAFLVIVVSPIVFPVSVYLPTLLASPFVALFVVPFFAAYFFEWRRSPRRLGTSPHGVYLEYAHPPKNSRIYLAWSDVRELEAPTPLNKKAIKFDTALGDEYVHSVSADLVSQVRAAFDAGRSEGGTAVGQVASAPGPLFADRNPLLPAEISWVQNPLRTRWFAWGAVLLIAQVPVIPLLVDFYTRYGVNQGETLFLLPAIFGASLLVQGVSAPKRVGVSAVGFSVEERKGLRTVPWADVLDFIPMSRGFRYKSHTGVAEIFPRIDATAVETVALGLERFHGNPRPASIERPQVPEGASWVRNRASVIARALLLTTLCGPATVIAVSFAVIVWVPSDAVWGVLGATLPALVLVFAIYPYVVWKSAPVAVATTGELIAASYGRRTPAPGLVRVLPFGAIDFASSRQRKGTDLSVVPRLPGRSDRYLSFRTRGGVMLGLGPITPEIERGITSRLSPSQLRDPRPDR